MNEGQDFGECWTFSCAAPPDQPFFITSDLFFGLTSRHKRKLTPFLKQVQNFDLFSTYTIKKKQIFKILRLFGLKLQPALFVFSAAPGEKGTGFLTQMFFDSKLYLRQILVPYLSYP